METNKKLIEILKHIKKSQNNLEISLERGLKDPNINTSKDELNFFYKQKLVDDPNLDVLKSVASGRSFIANGIGLTSYILSADLTESQMKKLVEHTLTNYITIEHLNNKILTTNFYKRSEPDTSFYTEIKNIEIKKPWYKFWKK